MKYRRNIKPTQAAIRFGIQETYLGLDDHPPLCRDVLPPQISRLLPSTRLVRSSLVVHESAQRSRRYVLRKRVTLRLMVILSSWY